MKDVYWKNDISTIPYQDTTVVDNRMLKAMALFSLMEEDAPEREQLEKETMRLLGEPADIAKDGALKGGNGIAEYLNQYAQITDDMTDKSVRDQTLKNQFDLQFSEAGQYLKGYDRMRHFYKSQNPSVDLDALLHVSELTKQESTRCGAMRVDLDNYLSQPGVNVSESKNHILKETKKITDKHSIVSATHNNVYEKLDKAQENQTYRDFEAIHKNLKNAKKSFWQGSDSSEFKDMMKSLRACISEHKKSTSGLARKAERLNEGQFIDKVDFANEPDKHELLMNAYRKCSTYLEKVGTESKKTEAGRARQAEAMRLKNMLEQIPEVKKELGIKDPESPLYGPLAEDLLAENPGKGAFGKDSSENDDFGRKSFGNEGSGRDIFGNDNLSEKASEERPSVYKESLKDLEKREKEEKDGQRQSNASMRRSYDSISSYADYSVDESREPSRAPSIGWKTHSQSK